MRSCVSLVFPITVFPVSRLLLLCHEPNLPFRSAFNGQKLIEGFKDNSMKIDREEVLHMSEMGHSSEL